MTLLAVYLGYARASLAMEAVQGLFGSDGQATVPEKLNPPQAGSGDGPRDLEQSRKTF